MKETRKNIKGRAASYPSTAAKEQKCKNVFQSLLDTTFIKGEIRVLDKYPNTDGFLEITDSNHYPIGKVDIQLKTLNVRNYKKPCYQCEEALFSYAEDSALPVIIVAVDCDNKRAYWRHLNKETIVEVSRNLKGKTYSLKFDVSTCIDGDSKIYIDEWTRIAKETTDKIKSFDEVYRQKIALEKELGTLQLKLADPTNLPLQYLKEIHSFLDHYNYILDIEFPLVKKTLYPDYWKIGMGVLNYNAKNANYILYPIEFKREQTLIKKIQHSDYNIPRAFFDQSILLVSSGSSEKIRKEPAKYAYESLKNKVIDTVRKSTAPIENEFLAHEYLTSFIDSFFVYLGLEKKEETYDIGHLKFMLLSVLPALVEQTFRFADDETVYYHHIDSYRGMQPSQSHTDAIAYFKNRINNGHRNKVDVTLVSTAYNMDTVRFYINLLETRAILSIQRKYKINQRNNIFRDAVFENRWDKSIFFSNLVLLLQNFHDIYQTYISTYFPFIKNHLSITQSTDATVVHVLYFSENSPDRPYFEICTLRPEKYEKGEMLFCLSDDPENPIDRSVLHLDSSTCKINGKNYQIAQVRGMPLSFMNSVSPTYALLTDILLSEIERFFHIRTR